MAAAIPKHSAGSDAGIADHLQLDDFDHLRGEVHLRCVSLHGKEILKDEVTIVFNSLCLSSLQRDF